MRNKIDVTLWIGKVQKDNKIMPQSSEERIFRIRNAIALQNSNLV